MKAVFVFCFCFTILVSTDARPPGIKRLLGGLAATKLRRTDISPTPSCQLASQALGQLLEHAQQTMAGMYMPHGVNIVFNFDVFNAEEREDVICQLSDLGTLSALYDAVEDLGILDHLIRRAYNYISVMSPMDKIRILDLLENIDDHSWIEPEELQIKLNLYNTLESTGLVDHDPEGKNHLYEIYTEYMPDFLDGYSPEPLSDEPLQSQTNKLTNDIRKVWNLHVKQRTEWNANYSEELRHNIKEWTGLVIGHHNDMKAIVSDVLEAASNSGLQGIIDVVKEYGVPRHLLKKAYSLLMENIDWLIDDLEASVNPPSYNGNYGSYGYGDYQDITAQINGDLIELFSNFRHMGLLNLEDDL